MKNASGAINAKDSATRSGSASAINSRETVGSNAR